MHLPVHDMTLTTGQVAQMCGWSEATFREKRAGLEALGFPKKLPGFPRYSRPAVEAWFRSNGGQAATAIEPVITIEVDAARDALEGEYAA